MTIEFVRPWQGRQRGQIDDVLAPGIAATLVDYGFARYVKEEPKRTKKRGRPPSVQPETDDGAEQRAD